MSKSKSNYSVEFTIIFEVFVEGAGSEDEAIEYAESELPMSCSGGVVEVRTTPLNETESESVRRHADFKVLADA